MSAFSGMGGSLSTTLYYLLYFLPVLAIIIVVAMSIRNKMVFKYPVRIFKIRENGKVQEINCKGGYISRRNSAPFFRIRLGKWWWQIADLTTTPNPAYLDEQDRVYYKQIDVGTYIQLRRRFDSLGTTLNYTPVECDVKYGAILDIHRVKEVLRTEPTWKKVLPYAGLILMAIVFIVAYAMLMNKCGAGA